MVFYTSLLMNATLIESLVQSAELYVTELMWTVRHTVCSWLLKV